MAHNKPATTLNSLDPRQALRLLEQRAKKEQDELASQTDVGEDVLDYLAKNGAVATRRAVAANPGAAAKTNRLLADDPEDDVRVELASKIGRLFPGLLLVEQKRIRDLTIETLEKLARDEVPRVRAMLAEEIKHLDCVPKPVVDRLARDVEEIVAAPILEYSPLLTDTDLIEIVTTAHTNAMLAAVARRKGLSGEVAEFRRRHARHRRYRRPARQYRRDYPYQDARQDRHAGRRVAEWHGPLVLRTELSPRAIRRIAAFVASALIDLLAHRNGLDDATRTHLSKRLRERQRAEAKTATVAAVDAAGDVKAAYRKGRLDDAFVAAAAEACQKDTVVSALSVLAKAEEGVVRRVLELGSAKAITSLAWKGGLSMRIAFKLQTTIMHLKGKDLLPARGGVDYPLDENEMRWHLGYFGIT